MWIFYVMESYKHLCQSRYGIQHSFAPIKIYMLPLYHLFYLAFAEFDGLVCDKKSKRPKPGLNGPKLLPNGPKMKMNRPKSRLNGPIWVLIPIKEEGD